MFERFTERALQVVMIAQEEARRIGHNYVGTEQILLGLIGEGTGIGYTVLNEAGLTIRRVRQEIEDFVGRGTGYIAIEIPFTPRGKKVLEIASSVSNYYRHGYIGTEHLLAALLKDREGVAIKILKNLGLSIKKLRFATLFEISKDNINPYALPTYGPDGRPIYPYSFTPHAPVGADPLPDFGYVDPALFVPGITPAEIAPAYKDIYGIEKKTPSRLDSPTGYGLSSSYRPKPKNQPDSKTQVDEPANNFSDFGFSPQNPSLDPRPNPFAGPFDPRVNPYVATYSQYPGNRYAPDPRIYTGQPAEEAEYDGYYDEEEEGYYNEEEEYPEDYQNLSSFNSPQSPLPELEAPFPEAEAPFPETETSDPETEAPEPSPKIVEKRKKIPTIGDFQNTILFQQHLEYVLDSEEVDEFTVDGAYGYFLPSIPSLLEEDLELWEKDFFVEKTVDNSGLWSANQYLNNYSQTDKDVFFEDNDKEDYLNRAVNYVTFEQRTTSVNKEEESTSIDFNFCETEEETNKRLQYLCNLYYIEDPKIFEYFSFSPLSITPSEDAPDVDDKIYMGNDSMYKVYLPSFYTFKKVIGPKYTDQAEDLEISDEYKEEEHEYEEHEYDEQALPGDYEYWQYKDDDLQYTDEYEYWQYKDDDSQYEDEQYLTDHHSQYTDEDKQSLTDEHENLQYTDENKREYEYEDLQYTDEDKEYLTDEEWQLLDKGEPYLKNEEFSDYLNPLDFYYKLSLPNKLPTYAIFEEDLLPDQVFEEDLMLDLDGLNQQTSQGIYYYQNDYQNEMDSMSNQLDEINPMSNQLSDFNFGYGSYPKISEYKLWDPFIFNQEEEKRNLNNTEKENINLNNTEEENTTLNNTKEKKKDDNVLITQNFLNEKKDITEKFDSDHFDSDHFDFDNFALDYLAAENLDEYDLQQLDFEGIPFTFEDQCDDIFFTLYEQYYQKNKKFLYDNLSKYKLDDFELINKDHQDKEI